MKTTIYSGVFVTAQSLIWKMPMEPMSGCSALYPTKTGLVDQELSKQLKALYEEYQLSLKLQGKNGFGFITSENYDKYLLQYFLIPSANKYLKGLSERKA